MANTGADILRLARNHLGEKYKWDAAQDTKTRTSFSQGRVIIVIDPLIVKISSGD